MLTKEILEKIKNLQIKQVIYPVITSALLVITIVLVATSARFLNTNINKAFNLNEKLLQSSLTQLDIEGFKPVARKLGIQLNDF